MKLAVLLPHYNNLCGLRVTLSALKKEEEGFDLFVIDDGSGNTEGVKVLINEFEQYFKIYLDLKSTNSGITAALNTGLSNIFKKGNYRYVARIDAGDIPINSRLRKQVDFMEKNSKIGLLSSYVDFTDQNGALQYTFKPINDNDKLKKLIHVYNPFIHPAVMMRSSSMKLAGNYPSKYEALEDHAYFMNMLKHTEAAIMEEVLLIYEINPQGISLSKRAIQTSSRLRLFLNNYYFGWYPTYGLIRAFLTKLIPYTLLQFFKRAFYK